MVLMISPREAAVSMVRWLLLAVLWLFGGLQKNDRDQPLLHLCRLLCCHIYFRCWRRSIFPKYDYSSSDPVKRSFLVGEAEHRIEYPASEKQLRHEGGQELLLTGMRTSGEFLLVRLVRAPDRRAQIHVVLRDQKGRLFTALPNSTTHLPLDISQGSKFHADGLRMLCLEPMRKWRIAFNGMMLNEKTREPVYVRLAFLWTASTDVMDWHNMIPAHRLIKYCLHQSRKLSHTIGTIERCTEFMNGYEQSGYMVGTVHVSQGATTGVNPVTNDGGKLPLDEVDDDVEPEQELLLRGNFVRLRHPPDEDSSLSGREPSCLNAFRHTFVYGVKGQVMQLSGLKFGDDEHGLVFGSFVGTSGFKDPIEHVLNESGNEIDIQDAFSSPVVTVSTFELPHNVLRSEEIVQCVLSSSLGWNHDLRIATFDAMIGGAKATGLSIEGIISGADDRRLLKPALNILDFDYPRSSLPYVLCLSDPRCKDASLTGGKGSSLAVLAELSSIERGKSTRQPPVPDTEQAVKIQFTVPGGIVVTTEAFKWFMQSPAMAGVKNDIQRVLSTSSVEESKTIAEECMRRVAEEPIPSCIATVIVAQLRDVFSADLMSKRFAVRSSCAGEDSEDMSAAGQMQTFLGVRGQNEILNAVAKCWASQFSHAAISYKRRYGQELVGDMAVVVMEMVPADCAGVLFTCDPLTGNPSTIYITSNFGLGESVVSALTDPDTIRVSRKADGSMRIDRVLVGKKDVKIVMDLERGGTREEKTTGGGTPNDGEDGDEGRTEAESRNDSTASISGAQAIRLAYVGAAIERCYGNWRDVEWAFFGGDLFVLQARPVTFIDRATDFEISCELDRHARAENSCYSKANVGEVLNGAQSPLGTEVMEKVCGNGMLQEKGRSPRGRRFAANPYTWPVFRIVRQHFFIDLSEAFRQFLPGPGDVKATEAAMLNICGRILDDPEFYEEMGDNSDLPRKTPFFEEHMDVIQAKWLARMKIIAYRWLARRLAQYPSATMTIDELFDGFIHAMMRMCDYGAMPHFSATIGSSMWSSEIVGFLSKHTNESIETIYEDMSKLLASANDVVSCDAPRDLESLAKVIVAEIGKDRFSRASTDDAVSMLENQSAYPKSHAAFGEFLDKHGHRGFNEFDIYRKTWALDPSGVTSTLQAMMRHDVHEDVSEKAHETVWAAVNSIKCQLTFAQKVQLSAIVYMTRRAVGSRELSKSLWIWSQHRCRLWSWALAAEMRRQGRIPEDDLLFFCSIYEINKLRHTRDPAIISRAIHRRRLYPDLVKLQFPEYARGFVKPIQEEAPTFEDGIVKLKGFPISKGRIQAKARVITTIDEARDIQRGEILITYATDIGWSPYFPLLAGIATELGGLMSHGAVVAREYGLPCVVGVFGARQVFRTGDTVLLDGGAGILLKVDGDDDDDVTKSGPTTE